MKLVGSLSLFLLLSATGNIASVEGAFAQDQCAKPDWVPADNSKSPTTKVRCCGYMYSNGKDVARCDTASCVNNFNGSSNRNCFNYGAPGTGKGKGAGSAKCPFADSDHAICDTSYYDSKNGMSCRTNPNGKNHQTNCLGKVKCNTLGVTVPKKGHSDGTAAHDGTGSDVCAGAEDGFKAGDDCFYDGSSENWKVCDGGGEPAPSGGSYGDPHVRTWGGDQFDFHGACDLLLLNSPNFGDGKGLEIHIRTKIRTWWSFIESAAIKIGDDIFEVKGGKNEFSYWINGVPGTQTKNGNLESKVGGYDIKFKDISPKQKSFRFLNTPGGVSIGFETFNDFVRVGVRTHNKDHFKGAYGLMGSFPNGDKVSREGDVVMTDMNAFGQEWQVRDTEDKIFHELEGPQYPEAKCTMPTATQRTARQLREASIDLQDAKRACEHVANPMDFDACVFDVLAMNDKDMAGSY